MTEDEFPVTESAEETSYLNRTEANVDLTGSKINDSEIFENGQTAKEDHQRSFIYIQNAKSRLPWKTKTHGSFFIDDFSNAKAVVRGGNDNLRPFKVVSQPIKTSYYKESTPAQNSRRNKNENKYVSRNFPFPVKSNIENKKGAKNWDEMQRYVPYNDKTMQASKTDASQPYYANKGYQLPYKINPPQRQNTKTRIEHKVNKSVRFPYQRGNYKIPYATPVSATVIVPTVLYEHKKPKENNKYSPHNEGIDESQFNCFNKDCGSRPNNYRVNMNNGIMRGMNCVCQNIPMFHAQAQDWRARKKPLTASEKAYNRALNSNNTDDYPYELLIKEMKKLTRIVDGLDSNVSN